MSTQAQAQAKIAEAIKNNPEIVISAALELKPSIKSEIDALRKADGTLQGVAAIACKSALRGKTNEETIENMVSFAKLLLKQ